MLRPSPHPGLLIAALTSTSLVLLACPREPTQTPGDPTLIDLAEVSGPALVFDDVHVFDGVDDLGIVDVLVEADTITRIGDFDLSSLPTGAEVTVVAGDGRLTLLPGLIDAHAHVSGPLDLRRAMSFGVTTVLDQFMDEETMGMIERQQAKGRLLDHADLRSAGLLATAPGGHGTEYGVEIATVASPAEVPAWMADRVEAGVDWIKIAYDDGHAFGRPFGNFDAATLAALIEAAHERGLLAIVHVSDLEAGREAAALGADGLAHVFFDAEADDGFVALAVERELFVTDTLVVVHAACGDPSLHAAASAPGLLELSEPVQLAQLRVGLAGVRAANEGRLRCEPADASVLRLHEAGVDLLASTDAPNFGLGLGPAMHLELGVLVGAGLSPIDALRAATEAPARRFGLDDRGRIAVGRRADLLLVDGDPTVDVRATTAIVGVWKAGHASDLDGHRATIAEHRAKLDALRQRPPPAGAESGLVSDFDDGSLSPSFGAGWSVSTDAMIGGSSTASLKPAAGSMLVEGRVEDHPGSRWAGASFTAGDELGQPANLSAFESVEITLRGTPGHYVLMIFTASAGMTPAAHSFELARDEADANTWTAVSVRLEDLGIDGGDIVSVFVGAVDLGDFELSVDELRFR